MRKKISVIVPVYNSEKYIRENFECILKQKYDNIELLYINDGSTDNSSKILDEISNNNKFVKVINKTNGGVSSARNSGLENCTGDYIIFLDSDDMIDINCFSDCMSVVEKYNPDIIKFGIVKKLGFIKKQANVELKSDYMYLKEQYEKLKYKLLNSYDLRSVVGILYRRDCLKGIKFNTDLKMAEDSLFFSKVFKNSDSLYYINKPYYIYRYNANSVTHKFDYQKNIKLLEDVINVNKIIRESFKLSKEESSYYNKLEIKNSINKCIENGNYKSLKVYIQIIKENKKICDEVNSIDNVLSVKYTTYCILKIKSIFKKIISFTIDLIR